MGLATSHLLGEDINSLLGFNIEVVGDLNGDGGDTWGYGGLSLAMTGYGDFIFQDRHAGLVRVRRNKHLLHCDLGCPPLSCGPPCAIHTPTGAVAHQGQVREMRDRVLVSDGEGSKCTLD